MRRGPTPSLSLISFPTLIIYVSAFFIWQWTYGSIQFVSIGLTFIYIYPFNLLLIQLVRVYFCFLSWINATNTFNLSLVYIYIYLNFALQVLKMNQINNKLLSTNVKVFTIIPVPIFWIPWRSTVYISYLAQPVFMTMSKEWIPQVIIVN